jgi:hypothetical protein
MHEVYTCTDGEAVDWANTNEEVRARVCARTYARACCDVASVRSWRHWSAAIGPTYLLT